jgi:cytidylate kinase
MSRSQRKLAIAIDGPSASGKTTTAKAVAQRLGYLHVDTGAMYRALALKAVRENVSLGDASEVEAFLGGTSVDCVVRAGSCRVLLDGADVTDEIRENNVSLRSSEIAVLPQVRRWLVARQRKLAEGGGVVMEGRDIGTVVLPDADLKIYLDAASEERASRRWLEERGAEGDRSRKEVLKEIEDRDHRDMTRENSPLEVAPGAVRIDTTSLTIDEQVEEVLREVKRVLTGGGSGEARCSSKSE